MKKTRKFLLIGMIVVSFLLIFNILVGANEMFSNTKTYDPEKQEITYKNFQGEDILKAQLTTPLDYKKIDRGEGILQEVFCIKFNSVQSHTGDLIEKLEYYDVLRGNEKTNREITYKQKVIVGTKQIPIYEKVCSKIFNEKNQTLYDNCTQVLQSYRTENITYFVPYNNKQSLSKDEIIEVCGFVDIRPNEKIEWIPTIKGLKNEEWATWTSGLNIGLISYYKFDETSGTNLSDSVGSNNGNLANMVEANWNNVGFCKIGGCLSFDGTDDRVDILDDNSLDLTDLTINFWIKTNGSADDVILTKGNGANGNNYIILMNGNNARAFANDDGGGLFLPVIEGIGFSGGWDMVTVIINTTFGGLYQNSTLMVSSNTSGTINNNNENLTLGYNIGGSYHLQGALDEMGIWGRSLTQSEINDLYNSGVGITYKGDFTNPNVTINLPTPYQNISNSFLDFNITAIDGSIGNCTYSLNFEANQTMSAFNSTYFNATNSSIGDGNYFAEFFCNDTWGNNNFTESVNFTIDTLYPTIENITTSSTTTQVTFNATFNDTNLKECNYTIFDSLGAVVSGSNNASMTCNSAKSVLLSAGTYNLSLIANDYSGNVNTTVNITSFTITSNGTGGTTTGGTGGTVVVVGEGEAQWTMETEGGGGSYQFNLIQGGVRKKPLLFENLGTSSRTIVLSCKKVEGKEDLCPYIIFEQDSFSLPLQIDVKTSIDFKVTIPNDLERGDYFANIIAKDDLNNQGVISVEGNLETFGFLTEIGTKITTSKLIGKISIPYIFISLFFMIIFGLGSHFLLFRRLKMSGGISFLLAFVGGFILLLFV